MSATRYSNIYIIILALMATAALAWSAIAAPCIEIGFFWASIAAALMISLFTWRKIGQIGQSGMLMIYFMLACCLTLAVSSIVDLANVSFLGEKLDAESGMLLGGVISFCLLTVIATRLSKCFGTALAWGAFIAGLMAWCYGGSIFKYISLDYRPVITFAVIICGMTAFISLCRCKHNLSDGQYLSVLCLIMTFISMSVPGTKANLVVGMLASLMLLLSGILFFSVRENTLPSARIGGLMLLFIGFSSITSDVLQKWLGMNEILAGIPCLIFGGFVICWMRFRKEAFPRGLYWASQFTFTFFSALSVIPEHYCDKMTSAMLDAMLLFIMVCVWYASSAEPPREFTWHKRLRLTGAFCCVILVVTITDAWFNLTTTMLAFNYLPVRYIAMLKDTPIWPGDAAFVRLAIQEGSLWAEDVGDVPSENMNLNSYIKKIRPADDRFSGVMYTKDNEQEDQGVDNEGIGISWVARNAGLELSQVYGRSSAGRAGLARGDRILTIDGRSAKDLGKDKALAKMMGEWKNGKMVSLNIVKRNGTRKKVSVEVGTNHQDPPKSRIITTASGAKVGYLYLESFNTAQFRGMDTHFTAFKENGVRDLVLDLRYNTGGSMPRTLSLANYIAGESLNGKTFLKLQYAQRHEDSNSEYTFGRLPESISTRRLVVLTTDKTCSASESIINGLRPYIPVYTVGSTTCGKPYMMCGIEFGDKFMYPVTTRVLNSLGEGYYTNGIRADYKVEDDLTHQLGDPQEGMLKKALEVLSSSAI